MSSLCSLPSDSLTSALDNLLMCTLSQEALLAEGSKLLLCSETVQKGCAIHFFPNCVTYDIAESVKPDVGRHQHDTKTLPHRDLHCHHTQGQASVHVIAWTVISCVYAAGMGCTFDMTWAVSCMSFSSALTFAACCRFCSPCLSTSSSVCTASCAAASRSCTVLPLITAVHGHNDRMLLGLCRPVKAG